MPLNKACTPIVKKFLYFCQLSMPIRVQGAIVCRESASTNDWYAWESKLRDAGCAYAKSMKTEISRNKEVSAIAQYRIEEIRS